VDTVKKLVSDSIDTFCLKLKNSIAGLNPGNLKYAYNEDSKSGQKEKFPRSEVYKLLNLKKNRRLDQKEKK